MWYNFTLAIGLILLLVSFYSLHKSLRFLKNAKKTVGTVITIEVVKGSEGESYKPIFKFKDELNEDFIYKHNVSSNPPSWEIGEEATITYNSNNPVHARMLTYFGVFSDTVIFMAIAMPLIVIGGGYQLAQYFLK